MRCRRSPARIHPRQTMCSQFDTDISKILKATAKGEVDSQLKAMTVIIVSYAAERFGHALLC